MELQTDNLGKVSVTIEKDYWDINKDYDKLTIVQVKDKFKTYISRKPVPAGAVLTDRKYWIPFSSLKEDIILDYNAFTDKYGKDLTVIKNHIKEIDEALKNFAQNVVLHEKGKPNGLASLNGSGKIPSEQLPSYVDDVLEYDTFDDMPEEGERGKIYVINDTDKVYRWSESKYIEVSPTEGIVYLGTFNSEDELYNYCCTEAVRNSEISLFTYKIPSNYNDVNYLMGGIMTQGYSDDGFIVQTFKHSSVKYSRHIDRHTGNIEADLYPIGLSYIEYDSSDNRIFLNNEFEIVSDCTIPVATTDNDGLLSKNDYSKLQSFPKRIVTNLKGISYQSDKISINYDDINSSSSIFINSATTTHAGVLTAENYRKIQYIDTLKKLVEVNDIFNIKYKDSNISSTNPVTIYGYDDINLTIALNIKFLESYYNSLGLNYKCNIRCNITAYNNKISYNHYNVINNLLILTNCTSKELSKKDVNISDAFHSCDYNINSNVSDIYVITFILETTINGVKDIILKSNPYTFKRSDDPIPTFCNLEQHTNCYKPYRKYPYTTKNTGTENVMFNYEPFNNIDYIRKQATLYLGKYENGKMKLSPISDEDKRILKSGISIEKYLTETNKKDYDVWLKLPTFLYKCESINDEQNGIHYINKLTICSDDSYINEEDKKNWNKWDGNTLIGVYKASLVDNNLHSLPNEIPVTDKSQKQFKELSRNRGDGFRLITYDVHKILALLFFTTSSNEEYDSYGYDSQAICGRGTKNEINDVWYPKKTGLCDYLGKTDTNAINGTGDENPTSENIMKGYGDGIKSVNFLGLENIYGDINEFMDDIYVMSTRDTSSTDYNKYILSDFALNNYYPTVTYINAEHTLTQDDLEAFNDNRPFIGIFKKDGNLLDRVIDLGDVNFLNDSAREGGIKKLLYGNHADVIPMEVDDSGSISGYNDYFSAYNTGYPFIRSGASNHGEGGMTCLIAGADENYHSSECGTRLIYEGTDETIEFTDDI